MTNDDNRSLYDAIQKVGAKVDRLGAVADADRELLKRLHTDHLRLEARVTQGEVRIAKTQSNLEKHVDTACVIQKQIREDVRETKEFIKTHVTAEDGERREVLRYLRDAVTQAKRDGQSAMRWAIGVGVSVVLALFGLLWATGAVGG